MGCHFLLQGSSWPRDGAMSPMSPTLGGRFFTTEPPEKTPPRRKQKLKRGKKTCQISIINIFKRVKKLHLWNHHRILWEIIFREQSRALENENKMYDSRNQKHRDLKNKVGEVSQKVEKRKTIWKMAGGGWRKDLKYLGNQSKKSSIWFWELYREKIKKTVWLPRWSSGWESACQWRGHGFGPGPGRSHMSPGNKACVSPTTETRTL